MNDMQEILNIENKILRQWLFALKKENGFIAGFNRNFRNEVNDVDANRVSIDKTIAKVFNKSSTMQFCEDVAIASAVAYAALLSSMVKAGGKSVRPEEYKLTAEEISKAINREFFGDNIIGRFNSISVLAAENARDMLSRGIKKGLSMPEIKTMITASLATEAIKMERLIRTEAQRINNEIALATYEIAKDDLLGIMFMATLDHRTCEECASHDRNEYYYHGPMPSVDDAPFIPLHPMCRCAYLPVSRLWDGKAKERASMGGYTKQKYSDWLWSSEQEQNGFARKVLGKNYENWLSGKYQLRGQISPQITVANYLRK